MQTITKITSGIAMIALGAGLAACGSGGDGDLAPPRAEGGVIVLVSCLGNATAGVDVVFGGIEESLFLRGRALLVPAR